MQPKSIPSKLIGYHCSKNFILLGLKLFFARTPDPKHAAATLRECYSYIDYFSKNEMVLSSDAIIARVALLVAALSTALMLAIWYRRFLRRRVPSSLRPLGLPTRRVQLFN